MGSNCGSLSFPRSRFPAPASLPRACGMPPSQVAALPHETEPWQLQLPAWALPRSCLFLPLAKPPHRDFLCSVGKPGSLCNPTPGGLQRPELEGNGKNAEKKLLVTVYILLKKKNYLPFVDMISHEISCGKTCCCRCMACKPSPCGRKGTFLSAIVYHNSQRRAPSAEGRGSRVTAAAPPLHVRYSWGRK